MKKLLAVILVFVMALSAMLLAACGDDSKESNDSGKKETVSDSGNQDANTGDADAPVAGINYKKPADAVKIDLSAADPSNGDIVFAYDSEGRVTVCRYKLDGEEISVSYQYADGGAVIYAFSSDSTVVAEDEVKLSSDYDASYGFAAIDGYYFKGYKN